MYYKEILFVIRVHVTSTYFLDLLQYKLPGSKKSEMEKQRNGNMFNIHLT